MNSARIKEFLDQRLSEKSIGILHSLVKFTVTVSTVFSTLLLLTLIFSFQEEDLGESNLSYFLMGSMVIVAYGAFYLFIFGVVPAICILFLIAVLSKLIGRPWQPVLLAERKWFVVNFMVTASVLVILLV